MPKACYRSLRWYKYQLMAAYRQEIEISGYEIDTSFLKLTKNGSLTIEAKYAWDGPSGPTFDTPDFMRGSLVHDALYQLIRMGQLPYSCKEHADQLLRTMCLDDGMWAIRVWWVYLAVKCFGGSSARPGTEKPDEIFRVPPD